MNTIRTIPQTFPLPWIVLLTALILISPEPWGKARAAGFDASHTLLDQILKLRVTNGLVDYKALKADTSALDLYLTQTAAITESEFNAWKPHGQIAFLINLYNAATLRMILDHYPLDSIKDIGWILKGPWDQPVVQLFGKKPLSLMSSTTSFAKTIRNHAFILPLSAPRSAAPS